MAWTTRSSSGLGQSHQSGASSGHDRVEMRAEPRDLVTLEVGHLEEAAVGGRPDRLGQVADVEAARSGRPAAAARPAPTCRSRRRRRRPTSSVRGRVTTTRSRARAAPASARREPPRSRAPRTSPARPRRAARRGSGRRRDAAPRPPAPPGLPAGRAARRAVGEQLPCGRGVCGDERRPAGERLEGLVRDHPRGLRRRPEDAERAAGRLELAREAPRSRPTAPTRRSAAASSSSGSSWPLPTMRNGISGASAAAARIVSRPCSGISLPTKSTWNGASRLPAGEEEPVLGADEADLRRDRAAGRTPRGRSARGPRCRRRRRRRGGSAAVDGAHDARPRASRGGSGRGRRRACRRARRAG